MGKGFWEKESPAAGSRCESKSMTYVALLEDENLNITNTLENILQSTASGVTKLKNVHIIVSKKTDKLRSIDIHLISKIMGKFKFSVSYLPVSNLTFHIRTKLPYLRIREENTQISTSLEK